MSYKQYYHSEIFSINSELKKIKNKIIHYKKDFYH